MNSKALGMDSARIWLIRLIVLLIVLLVAMYVVYVLASPGPSSWSKFWAYCNSSAARTVGVGFFLPIVILLVQVIFNVGGAIEERIARERDTLHQRRLECIERTKETWNELYDLASEVRHLPVTGDATQTLRQMLIRAEGVANRGEEVVDMWHLRFGLPEEHEHVLLTFINVLLHAATTAAHSILDGEEEKESRDLQDALGVIQEWVKAIAHHRIIMLLEHWAELLRLQDGSGSSQSIEEKKSVIEQHMGPLKTWAKHIWREQIDSAILPGVEGREILVFREKAQTVQDWLVRNPGKRITDSSESADLEEAFHGIPPRALLSRWKIPYSKSLVRELAKWFAYESIAYALEERARQLRRIVDESSAGGVDASEIGLPEA